MAKVNWLAERRSFASTDELNKYHRFVPLYLLERKKLPAKPKESRRRRLAVLRC